MDKYLHLPDKYILLMAGARKRNLSLYEHIMNSDTTTWEAKNVIVIIIECNCNWMRIFFVCYSDSAYSYN